MLVSTSLETGVDENREGDGPGATPEASDDRSCVRKSDLRGPVHRPNTERHLDSDAVDDGVAQRRCAWAETICLGLHGNLAKRLKLIDTGLHAHLSEVLKGIAPHLRRDLPLPRNHVGGKYEAGQRSRR